MPSATVYAKMHRRFLQTQQPKMYLQLKEKGELQDYLKKIGQDAVQMYEAIEASMLTAKDLPEDYPERVKALERIPFVAEEIVLNDLVFQPLPQQ